MRKLVKGREGQWPKILSRSRRGQKISQLQRVPQANTLTRKLWSLLCASCSKDCPVSWGGSLELKGRRGRQAARIRPVESKKKTYTKRPVYTFSLVAKSPPEVCIFSRTTPRRGEDIVYGKNVQADSTKSSDLHAHPTYS
jgi:hypothetical protein